MNANENGIGECRVRQPKRKPRTRLMWVPTLSRDGSERMISFLEEQTWPFRRPLLHSPFIAVMYSPAGDALEASKREAFRLRYLEGQKARHETGNKQEVAA